MGKIADTRELYKEVLENITKNKENWTTFLNSASWNFKYDFDDQILIYAQRPDAKACATMNEWNKKLRRWINSGTKPIFVFNKDPYSEYPFKLVFDLSDTHNYNNTEYKLWEIKEEYVQDIVESLEASFGYIEEKETLAQAINSISQNMVMDNIEDYLESIINHKENSILKISSDEEIKDILATTVRASVSYMMMTRCGINAKEKVREEEFSYVQHFNNQELTTILGAAVSDIAEIGLREIARTLSSLQKSEKLQNRTFEKNDKEMYFKDNQEIKGGNENGRENRIHETGRVLHAQPKHEERESSSREIRSNEIQLSEKSQELRTNNISDESRTNETPNGNTRTGEQENTENGGKNGETEWSNRRTESERPNEMGGANEQLQDDSRGDSSERIDLHLGIYNIDEQHRTPYVVTEAKINQILALAKLKISNNEIRDYLNAEIDKEKRINFIQSAFDNVYTSYTINSEMYGYKAFNNGVLFWKGNFVSRNTQTFVKWEDLEEHYQSMILLKQLYDRKSDIQTTDGQLTVLEIDETVEIPELQFSQEFIDRFLQEAGTETKYKIYKKMEKYLSLKDQGNFLKVEYAGSSGFAGASYTINGSGIGVDYTFNGITLYRGYTENRIETTLKWNYIAKRISELIKADRYLNPKEKEEYSNWLKKQEQENELREAEERLENQVEQKEYEYHLGDTVYIGADEYEIAEIKDNTVTLYDPKFPIVSKEMEFEEFERKVRDNYSNNHLIVNTDNPRQEPKEVEIDDVKDVEKQLQSGEMEELALERELYDFANSYEIEDIEELSVEKIKERLQNENSREKIIHYLTGILTAQSEESDFTVDLKNIIERLKSEYEKNEVKNVDTEKMYKIGQKVYLESDKAYNIHNIDIEKDKIELQDLQMSSPIFREESILTFENLYNQNERNFPKEDIKPNFVRTSNKIQNFILHPEIAESERNNFRITHNDLGIGTAKEKFERNIEAIKVLKKCEDENRYATPEEQKIMSQYVGWGALQQAFKEDDSSWSNEYKILKELLNDEEYKNARGSVLTAFYTPPIVINSMYEILQNMGLKEANILEPACRSWQFFWNVAKRT